MGERLSTLWVGVLCALEKVNHRGLGRGGPFKAVLLNHLGISFPLRLKLEPTVLKF